MFFRYWWVMTNATAIARLQRVQRSFDFAELRFHNSSEMVNTHNPFETGNTLLCGRRFNLLQHHYARINLLIASPT